MSKITIFSILLYVGIAFAGAPSVMTFQSKIVGPNGTPLEASSVNFRFTILDAAGTCVLYVEDYSNVNMTGTQGVVAIPLGSGTKVFPLAAVSLHEVFNNTTTAFNCQAGGTSSPTATDNRQVVMQFNDGGGWQTLPQMAINAVPFANYATRAESLGAYAANAYLRPSTLPTCTAGQALNWDGSAFTCIVASGGGGSTYTGVTSIANASGDITLAPAAGTGAIRITSNTPSTSTTTGAVVITGGMGVSGAINAAGNISTSGSVSSTSMLSTTSVFTPQLYGTSTASGSIKIDGTSNATKGDVLLASQGGNVGIGTTSPTSSLHIYKAFNPALKLDNGGLNSFETVVGGGGIILGTNGDNGTTNADLIFGADNVTVGHSARLVIKANTGNIGVGTLTPSQNLHVIGNILADRVASADSIYVTNSINSGATEKWIKIATLPPNAAANGSFLDLEVYGGQPLTAEKYKMWIRMGARTPFTAYISRLEGSTMSFTHGGVQVFDTGAGYDVYLHFKGTNNIHLGARVTRSQWGSTGISTLYPYEPAVTTLPTGSVVFDSSTAAPQTTLTIGGYVGVGTTTPAYALSVSGDINVTGNFRVNGTILTGGGSSQTGVTSISNASGDITLAPAVGTGAVQINSGAASTSPTTGALIVSGGIGVSGAIYSGGAISSGSTISANTSMYTPQLYGTSTPSGNIRIDGTSNVAVGNVLLASAGGKVGIGITTTPSTALSFAGDSAKAIGMERSTGGNPGSTFTFVGGGASNGSTNQNGGHLTFLSGISTGTGSSNMYFATASAGASGTSDNLPTTKFSILGSGNVGIGTSSPLFSLSVGDGTANDGSILALGYGTVGTNGQTLTVAGAGTRMIWYPKKAAFRAGNVASTQWDDANIGNYSVAMGSDTRASAMGSVAIGNAAVASGTNAIAMHAGQASGTYAVAIGNWPSATAAQGMAIGNHVTADANQQLSVGAYNMPTGVENAGSWVTTDPLFTIGNGTGTGTNRSTAFMVLKNGNVGMGTTTPVAPLHIYAATDNGFRIDSGGTVRFDALTGIGRNMFNTSATGAAIGTFSSHPFWIATANGTRMYFDTSGNVGVGTTTPGAKLHVEGSLAVNSIYEGVSNTVNSTATYTIPDTSLNIRRITLTANTTISLPVFTTPASKVYSLTLFLKQDATGSRTVTFSGAAGDTIKWDSNAAPTISSAAGTTTIITLIKASDENVWYASMNWKEN